MASSANIRDQKVLCDSMGRERPMHTRDAERQRAEGRGGRKHMKLYPRGEPGWTTISHSSEGHRRKPGPVCASVSLHNTPHSASLAGDGLLVYLGPGH